MALGARRKNAQEKPVYPEPDRLPESHSEWFGRIATTARILAPDKLPLDQQRIVEFLESAIYNPFWALGKLSPDSQPTDLTKLSLERFQGWVWDWLRARGLTEKSIEAICADMAEQDAQIAEWNKNGRPPIAKVLGVDVVADEPAGGK